MNIIKLILLACPVVLASMLVFANPAVASTAHSAPVTTQITLVSAQPIHQSITPNLSGDSKSIMDQLGCNCASCVKSRLQMEGKLSLSSLL
ncbi:MAG: hypothetical protein HXY43_15605 [Fischerella sp.]|uniref:hypothetical protein n=1 Tax=Fischerella sp. TaxID=1191 RepID=UPI0017EB0BE8|nr:hypothetical protein [Fischerella sp.]NWF60638.1 hypothetical protein [Fischerella sp.]